ncbi:MAG TPA: trehalose-phosphatase [Kofleriaceae bacterium]|nr:trehalose-phosphatase [Kofleriaceae bacterium]
MKEVAGPIAETPRGSRRARTVEETVSSIWTELVRRSVLALLLDLDGTLIPFAPTPEQAQLDRAAQRMLEALQRAGVQVVVVSGRAQPALQGLCARLPGVWWFAEHGSWRYAEGEWAAPPAAASELDELARSLDALARAPGVRLERKARSLCLHWRLVDPELRDELIRGARLITDEWLETHAEFESLDGVLALEVRARTSHKGTAVAWVRERLPSARIIAIGDDVTDEDMFAALGPGDAAIAVGARPLVHARAHARLAGPSAVRELLRWLLDTRLGSDTGPPPLDGIESTDAARLPRAPLLVLSNRTPPSEELTRTRGVGGLLSALEPALRSRRGTWLGWSGHEREGEPSIMVRDRDELAIACFDLPPHLRQRFYGGFCNRALWPLLHSFPSRVSFSDEDWQAYIDANERYAAFAAELAAPDGAIWVHDFHLLLAARALRRHGHRGAIGLFLHVPFPSRDLFETLPWYRELLDGMLAFDLVGFHTEQWAEHFRETVAGVRGVRFERDRVVRGDDVTTIGVFPIGVDPEAFAAKSSPSPEIAGLRSALGGRRMILGVDRLDYSKGIPERLLAFEHLLERFPEWRGQVSLVQISVPSRADVPEYAELRSRVENLVGRINGHFGEADWVPVRYLYRSYDRDMLAELYRLADVALVTPLRDGMNLVAKEFVAAQDPAQPGVLVLSRFAGAAAELVDAVLTNPFHPDGLAADLDRALRMSIAERVARQHRLYTKVCGNTPAQWADRFLSRLAETRAS